MRKPWLRWVLAAVAAIWLGVAAFPVVAQRSGGSFGGGSFSSGGGSYGGGSYGGGSYGGGSYGGGGGGGCSCCGLPVTLAVIVIILLIQQSQKKKMGLGGPTSHGSRGWDQVDVSAVRLGIDWRARRELQAHLERLARRGQTSGQAGLAELLRETVLALRRTQLSWLYASVANYHPMNPPMAEGIFRQLTTDSRARFKEEMVRNVDGRSHEREVSAMKARAEEGEGVVVVTLVVAARTEILDVQAVDDAGRIATLLDELLRVANPHSLVAMEVIWSPAVEEDRMSTAELEAVYPELRKIDERSIAGRVFCGFCRGPFAAELQRCPHCGAPAPRPQAAAGA